jgi:hypothetical protein
MRIGFDLDGVLCSTPFGRMAVHAPSPVPALPADHERLYEAPPRASAFRVAIEWLRFAWRPAAPGAVGVLRDLSARHELFVVTGRSAAGQRVAEAWLRRRRLRDCLTGISMAPPGLRPAQHKLAAARQLSLDAHIDDDPRTAFHLARNGVARVFLLDHAGARGDTPLPPGLTLVRSLEDFARRIGEIPDDQAHQ